MSVSKLVISFFDELNRIINALEASAVNTFAALSPWLAPLAPAYIAWSHMTLILAFPAWVALAVAVVIELLGLSTISTALAFWRHNKRYSSDRNQAPVAVALGAFAAYLVVVLTVNVVLAIPVADAARPYVNIAAQGLLSMLSVPAAVTLAIRSQHSELLREIADGRKPKTGEPQAIAPKPQQAQPIQPAPVADALPIAVELSSRDRVLAFYRKHPHGTLTDAGRAAQVSRQRASQIVNALEAEGVINRNGKVTVK